VKAILWYREDSLSYEAATYHLTPEQMEFVYRHRGVDASGKKAALAELSRQRNALMQFLVEQGFDAKEFPSSIINAAANSPAVMAALREEVNHADLMLVLGGDNTFLQAASLLDHASLTRVVGINSNPLPEGEKAGGEKAGSFGGLLWPSLQSFFTHFVTHISAPELLEEWTRIEVELQGRRVGLALGEVFIGAMRNSHASHYSLRIVPSDPAERKEESKPEPQGSSGVVVFTGAGSGPGSWAGNIYGDGCAEFPQAASEIHYVVREPFGGRAKVCNAQSSFRPLEPHSMLGGVIPVGQQLEIASHHVRPAFVSLDANEAMGEFPFPNGEKVILRPMPQSVKVVAPRGV